MKKNIIIFVIMAFLLNLNCLANPKSEAKQFLKAHNTALKNHDIEKIKGFYDESYVSSDGFNLTDMAEMLEKTYDAYSNIKYKTKIHSIKASDSWAVAFMSDETNAKVYPEGKKLRSKTGYLNGTSSYIVYLKKENGTWKIIYDDILTEETKLTYGIARKINMELSTPIFIQKGKDYDVSLKMKKPENIFALGSISREEISYPIKDYKESFRRIPQSGDLERLVTANNKNLDEYAVASVGFTKVSINKEENKAKIEILGMAHIMKRINMEKPKKNEMLVENKK